MIEGICPECKQYKKLTEHHNPSKNILPQDQTLRKSAVYCFLCIDCHDKKGINAIERNAIKDIKKNNSFITSTSDLNKLNKQLAKGEIPEFNEEDKFIISAGSITSGSIFPISGTNLQLYSRNFYQKDNWDRTEYGWGIDVNTSEEIKNIQKGAPYLVNGSPQGFYYCVDILKNKEVKNNG